MSRVLHHQSARRTTPARSTSAARLHASGEPTWVIDLDAAMPSVHPATVAAKRFEWVAVTLMGVAGFVWLLDVVLIAGH